MKCENEFSYTLEEAYDIIRRLYKFEHEVCDFVRNIQVIRSPIIDCPGSMFNYSDEYVKGYNTAVHDHATTLDRIVDDYRKSRVVYRKEVK